MMMQNNSTQTQPKRPKPPPHKLAHRANLQAENAQSEFRAFENGQEAARAYADENQSLASVRGLNLLGRWTVTIIWLLVAICEYIISREMYLNIANGFFFGDVIFALVFLGIAVVLSELVYRPIKSTLLPEEQDEPEDEYAYTEEYSNEGHTIPTSHYLICLIGTISTIGMTFMFYNLSGDRVILQNQAAAPDALSFVNPKYDEYMPAGLFVIEVLLGIYVPFIFRWCFYRRKLRTIQQQAQQAHERYLYLRARACEMYDMYSREVQRYNQTYQAQEDIVRATPLLIRFLEEYYNITISGDAANPTNGSVQTTDPDAPPAAQETQNADQDMVKVLDAATRKLNKGM